MNRPMTSALALRPLVAFLGLCALFGGALRAQEAAVEKKPSADEIVAAYIDSLGGKETLEKLETMTVQGTMDLGAMMGRRPVTVRMKKRELPAEEDRKARDVWRYHVSIDLGGQMGKAEEGSDGVTYWEASAFGSRLIEGDELAIKARGNDPALWLDWKRHYESLEVVGEEKVEARAAWKVTAKPKTGPAETMWFDREKGRLLRSSSKVDSPMGSFDITTTLSDYKPVKPLGFVQPFKTVIVVAGQPEPRVLIMDEAKVNEPLDDALFAFPEEIRKLVEKQEERRRRAAERDKKAEKSSGN